MSCISFWFAVAFFLISDSSSLSERINCLYHNYISIKNETEMVIEQKVKDGNAEYWWLLYHTVMFKSQAISLAMYECVTRGCCASVGVIQTAHRVKITKFLVDFCR